MSIRSVVAFAIVLSAVACNGDKTNTSQPSATATSSAKASASVAAKIPAPKKGKVFFITPLDGAKVFPDVDMNFGSENREIVAAGTDANQEVKGHFWVIVDGAPVEKGKALAKDAKHHQWAKGESFGALKLEAGKHKLTLQLADGDGNSYGEALSKTIEVEVVADDGPRSVKIAEPEDGATVKSKFKVKFEVAGMKIQNAGEAPKDRITGHHHVLIDNKEGHMIVGVEIPADKTHIHYGKGQTEAELELAKGKHTLTAQFADGSHRSYGPSMAHTITVTVE